MVMPLEQGGAQRLVLIRRTEEGLTPPTLAASCSYPCSSGLA